jgi:hypothetical protein
MTDVVRLMMACVSLCVNTPCFAGDSRSAMVVTVQSEATTFKAGEDIMLYVTAKNISSAEISLGTSSHSEGGPHFGVDFAVKMVTPAGDVKTNLNHPSGSHGGIAVKPGDEIKEGILIAKKVDMTEPGKYTVSIGPVGNDQSYDFKVLGWSAPVTVNVVK